MGEVATIVMGQAPPGAECNFDRKGTPFVKAGEFGESRPTIREWTTKPLKMAQSSDVLVCVVGATCGKLNLGADCAIGRSVAALRPNENLLNQRYLHGFLMGWTQRLRSGSQGSAQGVITRDMLASIPTPLPPLAEQERVVQLLDQADALRQLRNQAGRRTDDFVPALFDQMFLSNPQKRYWPHKLLRLLTQDNDKINYGVVQPGDDYQGGIPLVRVGDFESMGVSKVDMKHIHPDIESNYVRSRLRGDEVLISCGGAVGKVVLADESIRGANIARAIARVPLNDSVNRIYVAWHCRTQDAQHYFLTETRTVNQPTLNITQIESLPVPLPPLPLQEEFADRVREIRELEAEQARSAARLEELFQSLLHECFN